MSFTATATDISPADQAFGFTYSWSFGDGGTATGPARATYSRAAGTYTVTVTATDEYGETGTASGDDRDQQRFDALWRNAVAGTGSDPGGELRQRRPWDRLLRYTPGNTGGDLTGARELIFRRRPTRAEATTWAASDATEWLNYTVNVAAAGTYVLSIRVASSGQGVRSTLTLAGSTKTGEFTIPNTGGWQTWQTMTTSVQFTAGQQIMQVDFDTNGPTGYVGNLNWLALTTGEGPTANLVVPDVVGGRLQGCSGSDDAVVRDRGRRESSGRRNWGFDFAMATGLTNILGQRTPSKRARVDGA